MDEIKIKAFENSILELCNGVDIPWKIKYYILKDISEKALELSERICLSISRQQIQEKGDMKDAEST